MTEGRAALDDRTEKLSRTRRTIAARMVESLRVSAQLTTVLEADFLHVAALRQQVKEAMLKDRGLKLSFLPFVAKAALDALVRNPVINASLDMDKAEATYYAGRHLCVAVDTERGLLAPTIASAGEMTVIELAKAIVDIADRARTGRLRAEELSGGTFTITNTGSRGALFDTPIINQPQVAILGAGAIVERPVVVRLGADKAMEIRPMGYLALSYDHRLVDGADAARYLSDVRQALETPDWGASVLG